MRNDEKMVNSFSCSYGLRSETNRLLMFLQQRWISLGISRELQFWVHDHGESRTSPYMAREEELFYRGEKEVGRAVVTGWVLTKKEVCLLPMGCANISWQGVRAPPSGLLTLFNWDLFINFCISKSYTPVHDVWKKMTQE